MQNFKIYITIFIYLRKEFGHDLHLGLVIMAFID